MVRQEVEELSQRLNVKGNKAPAQPTIATLVGWLTSAWGKKLHQEVTAAHAAKQQKKDNAATRKVQAESNKQKCHQDIAMGDAAAFTGSLISKKVAELQDIAHTLGLKDDGKKDDLLLLIKSHLNSHPDLHNKECFAGLYVTHSLKQQVPPTTNENLAPPANRPHITPPPIASTSIYAPLDSTAGPSHLPAFHSHPMSALHEQPLNSTASPSTSYHPLNQQSYSYYSIYNSAPDPPYISPCNTALISTTLNQSPMAALQFYFQSHSS